MNERIENRGISSRNVTITNSQLNPIFQSEMSWMVVVYVGCEILVAIGAIFGNTLVITAFRRERRLRRRTNYYIVSLAVADLLVGLLGIPCALLAYSGYPKQLHACLFTVSLLVVLCTISIFSLVAVSVDRYWAILYPMGYSRNVRTKTAIGIICFCWVAGAIVGFLPLLGWNAGQSGQELEECRFTKVMNYNFLVFIYFATIIFPGLLMAAFYAHIYSVVVKQLKQMVTVNGTSGGSGAMLRVLGAARKREVKATQNLSIIVLFFMVCWFPLYTINFIQAYHKDISIPTFLMDSCIILTHLNSAGNPLLYAYHLKDFRAALRAVIFGGVTETDRRVIGRDNSAYLHDLEQRRRSSQLNLYAKSTKDQNLNLTHLPVINNKLSDIQESSRNESSIKVIPSENNDIPKTTSFFKFPLDRSLSRLKDREKMTNFANNNDKQDFTYNHLEESNASVVNDGSTETKEKEREEIVVNGGVINKGFLKKDEGGEEEKRKQNLEKRIESSSECRHINDKEENIPTKTTSDELSDGSGKLEESFSKYSCTNTEEKREEGEEKKKNDDSCDDADYGDDETDDDEDTNVKTGNEITTGIFNDCYVTDDDDDSVDEIDNSILSNDRVGSLVKNDDESCVSYRNVDNTVTKEGREMCSSCDLKRVDLENEEASIPYRNLEKIDSEVSIPYCELKKTDSEVDIPYSELKKVDSKDITPHSDLKTVDSKVGIPYNKLSSNDFEEIGNTYNDLNISDDECEKIGITCSNLQENEGDQIRGNLDRINSGESSQQGMKYTDVDNYDPERLEEVDFPYKSLEQKDSDDFGGRRKDFLETKRENDGLGIVKLDPKNVERSKNNEEASCTKDSPQNLKEFSDKGSTPQEKVTLASNSSAITTTTGNGSFEDHNEKTGKLRT